MAKTVAAQKAPGKDLRGVVRLQGRSRWHASLPTDLDKKARRRLLQRQYEKNRSTRTETAAHSVQSKSKRSIVTAVRVEEWPPEIMAILLEPGEGETSARSIEHEGCDVDCRKAWAARMRLRFMTSVVGGNTLPG